MTVKKFTQYLNGITTLGFSVLVASACLIPAVAQSSPQPNKQQLAVDGLNAEEPAVTSLAPEAPANLNATIYSRRAFQLFWDKATDDTVLYEVFIDSKLVNTTVGTNSTQRNLTPEAQYTVTVFAVNESGDRSNESTLTISMPGKPRTDGNSESGLVDSGTTDTGSTDSTSADAGDTDTGTTDSGNTDSGNTDSGSADAGNTDSGAADSGNTDSGNVDSELLTSTFIANSSDTVNAFYDADGYDTVDVIRIDVQTQTTKGICTIDDQSGCTLDDVKADIDPDDDFKVEIAVKVQGTDLPDDGSAANATLRQRGGTSRSFPQKSFRIKLDSKKNLWRNERRLQLNKHPNERARIRNKLSFDLMQELPNLPSLRTQFVNLWIDDGAGPEDYGLFTHVEFVVERTLHPDAGVRYANARELGRELRSAVEAMIILML